MITTTEYCEVLYCRPWGWPHEKDLWGNTALCCVTHTTHQHCYYTCRNYSTSMVLCSVTRLQEHKRMMEFVWTTTVSQTAWLLGNWSSLVGSYHHGNMFSSLINLLHMISYTLSSSFRVKLEALSSVLIEIHSSRGWGCRECIILLVLNLSRWTWYTNTYFPVLPQCNRRVWIKN